MVAVIVSPSLFTMMMNSHSTTGGRTTRSNPLFIRLVLLILLCISIGLTLFYQMEYLIMDDMSRNVISTTTGGGGDGGGDHSNILFMFQDQPQHQHLQYSITARDNKKDRIVIDTQAIHKSYQDSIQPNSIQQEKQQQQQQQQAALFSIQQRDSTKNHQQPKNTALYDFRPLQQFTHPNYVKHLFQPPGKEHYFLLHWLVQHYGNIPKNEETLQRDYKENNHHRQQQQHYYYYDVVDIGTRFVTSALALASTGLNVHTFDRIQSMERFMAFRDRTEQQWKLDFQQIQNGNFTTSLGGTLESVDIQEKEEQQGKEDTPEEEQDESGGGAAAGGGGGGVVDEIPPEEEQQGPILDSRIYTDLHTYQRPGPVHVGNITFWNVDLLRMPISQLRRHMDTWLIVLDTFHLPYSHPFERQFIQRLIRQVKYKGIVVLDDIHLNKEMKRWWDELQQQSQLPNAPFTTHDITLVGHLTGTGLLDFTPNRRVVVV